MYIRAYRKKLFAQSSNSEENFLLGVKNTSLKFDKIKKSFCLRIVDIAKNHKNDTLLEIWKPKKFYFLFKLSQVCKKNVEFLPDKIGVISEVIFGVKTESGVRIAPSRQVFDYPNLKVQKTRVFALFEHP